MEVTKPTTLYLIRHGEVNNPSGIIYGSSVDVPLSATGADQIRSLADNFQTQGIKPEAIYASHLTRAVYSAEILGEILNPEITVIQDKRLRDIDSPGLEKYTIDWVNTIEDIYAYKGPELEGVIIERPESLAIRMSEAIHEILRANEGKRVFVISHGHPIAFTMWRFLHPNEATFPSAADLIKQGEYLNKAETWHVKMTRAA